MIFTHQLFVTITTGFLIIGFATALPTTTRISVAPDGTEGNNYSGYYGLALSDNGLFAAFGSDASNLVPGDTNGKTDIFRRNNQTGEVVLISVGYDGSPANNSTSNPSISADGRWVAFASRATNLVENDTNGKSDVFVRDMLYGVTTRISVSPTGMQVDKDSTSHAISADGRWVAFLSGATNLVPGDTNGMADIFLRDMNSGATTLITLSSTGVQTNSMSNAPAISADGRYVAFASLATNLSEADKNTHWDIFLRDTHSGTTTMVSVRSDGTQGAVSNSYPPWTASADMSSSSPTCRTSFQTTRTRTGTSSRTTACRDSPRRFRRGWARQSETRSRTRRESTAREGMWCFTPALQTSSSMI